MRYGNLILSIFLAYQLAACDSDKSYNKLEPNDTILAFGDSLTQGRGAPDHFSYPSVLSELSGVRVVNEGVSGELSAAGLARLPRVLSRVQPDFLVLMHGGNDILQNRSASELKSNLSRMITMVQSKGIDLLLVCLPEKSLFSSCSKTYTELAEEHDVLLEKGIVAKLVKRPSMKSDAVHFNKLGYAALAEKIYDLLKASDAL